MTPGAGDMAAASYRAAWRENCQISYRYWRCRAPRGARPMSSMQPTNLRCEYFVDPIGIDAQAPRLSWQIAAPRQSAYQVVVDGMWDSGKVESDQSIHVAYGGPTLRSRQRCEWKVRVWDGDGEASSWSEPATFEMGLLDRADWQA